MSLSAKQIVKKQPSETINVSMDFSNQLASDETISSIVQVTSELRGEGTSDLTITNEAVSGQTVTMTIAGGTNRKVYRVEVQITTSASQTLEGDGQLKVEEK